MQFGLWPVSLIESKSFFEIEIDSVIQWEFIVNIQPVGRMPLVAFYIIINFLMHKRAIARCHVEENNLRLLGQKLCKVFVKVSCPTYKNLREF